MEQLSSKERVRQPKRRKKGPSYKYLLLLGAVSLIAVISTVLAVSNRIK